MKTVDVIRTIEDAMRRSSGKERWIDAIAVGQAVRQGDIYVHRVADGHRRGTSRDSRQLAPGERDSARHVAESPARVFEGIRLPDWCRPGTALGPLVRCPDRAIISHPEHAQMSLPAGTYQVTYQRGTRIAAGGEEDLWLADGGECD
jgi:hypothetical protein